MTGSRAPAAIHKRTIAAGAAVVALVGLTVLVAGWLFQVDFVRSVVPGTVAMKPATALMFVLSGAALASTGATGRWRLAGAACTVATITIALAFLTEYVVGWHLGIDEIPFRDLAGRAAHVAYPGRLAPATAVCFVLVGAGRLVGTRPRAVAALMFPVAAVASMCLVGYAYAIPAFYGPASAAKMALNTGMLLLVLVGGTLLSRPTRRLLAILATAEPGGVLARRLLPLALLTPLVLGWVRLTAQDAGVFDPRVGDWLLTAATSVCLVAVITWASASLNRSDRERRGLEIELYRLAGEDHLTGLSNRRRFEEGLARELALGARYRLPGCLLMIDLDRFKPVNDELGHEAGDLLLQCVADVMTERLRSTDLLGRIGGDEFVAYLPHTDVDAAGFVAEELLVLLHEGSRGLGEDMATTVSIGLARDVDGSMSPVTLLRASDLAMYSAKRRGGNRAVVYEPVGASEVVSPAGPHRSRVAATDSISDVPPGLRSPA